jgi:hypothetical protein
MRRLCRVLLAASISTGVLASTASAATGPTLVVDATSPDTHPISGDIYGLNWADPTFGSQISLPVDRWGGNGTETYNWQLGASNTSSDWYFENVADCFNSTYNWCSGISKNNVFAYRNFVVKDRRLGAKTLLTLPMAGYVAKDAPVGHPLTCGYPRTVWPNQDSFDPYDSNCGNGRAGGAAIPGTPTIDGTPITSSFNSAWIADLKRRYGPASAGVSSCTS